MSRTVSQIQMHSVPFVPGAGNLKNTLSSTAYTGMKLWSTPEGVEVSYRNIEFMVPWGNIIVATYEAPDLQRIVNPRAG